MAKVQFYFWKKIDKKSRTKSRDLSFDTNKKVLPLEVYINDIFLFVKSYGQGLFFQNRSKVNVKV